MIVLVMPDDDMAVGCSNKGWLKPLLIGIPCERVVPGLGAVLVPPRARGFLVAIAFL